MFIKVLTLVTSNPYERLHQKLPILLSKKTTKRGRGSKIPDFEMTKFTLRSLLNEQATLSEQGGIFLKNS